MIIHKRTRVQVAIFAAVFVILSIVSSVTPVLTAKVAALGSGPGCTSRGMSCGTPKQAPPAYKWTSKSTIVGTNIYTSIGYAGRSGQPVHSYSSITFTDTTPDDANHTYVGDDVSDVCKSASKLTVSDIGAGSGTATIAFHYPSSHAPLATAKCKNGPGASVSIGNTSNAKKASAPTANQDSSSLIGKASLNWKDETHIVMKGGNLAGSVTFSGNESADGTNSQYTSDSNVRTKGSSPEILCKPRLTIDMSKNGDPTKGTLQFLQASGRGCSPNTYGTGIPVSIGSKGNAPDLGGSGGQTDAQTPSCESSGNTLAWILCPIIEGIAKAADSMYSNLIQPLLVTKPVSFSSDDPTYKAWSQFRILGDIFLIIALLVVVFGQAIGGGLIDAYSAKKILPRLLISAVAINLSIYLVAAAVDITNIIGDGLINLIELPFKQSGDFKLVLYGSSTSTGLGMTALVTGGIWAIVSIVPLLGWLFTFLLIPLLLTLVAILATVVIRRGAILFLILVSPIAFALYCLPNTEKYFKQWWDLLSKTLLVYPIIAAIFGIANVLSITVNISTQGDQGATHYLSEIISVVALIIPLFLIPFSFKLAGGALGTLHDTLTNGRKRMHEAYKGNVNDPNSRQNRARDKLAARNVLNRSRGLAGISKLQKSDSKGARALGYGLHPVGMAFNAGDLEARHAALNKKEDEKRHLKSDYGPDTSLRALSATRGADGIWRSTTNGAEFSALEVQKAHQLYGRQAGQHATQTALDYELTKAGNTDVEYENFKQNAANQLDRMGYKKDEVNGIMKGIGFKNAGKYLDLKHSKWEKDEATGKYVQKIDHAALAQDTAVNYGNYPISNMKDVVPRELGAGFEKATAAFTAADGVTDAAARAKIFKDAGFADGKAPNGKDALTAEQMARRTVDDTYLIAESFNSRMQAGGGVVGTAGEGDSAVPISGGGTGAAGRAHEEINKLIGKVNNHKASHPNGVDRYGRGVTPPTRPPSPSGNGGGNGSTIIRPGSSDFNIPPGSLPPGN